jgi:heme/copper-type cytochrome/quinol oxidase subunit 3
MEESIIPAAPSASHNFALLRDNKISTAGKKAARKRNAYTRLQLRQFLIAECVRFSFLLISFFAVLSRFIL